MLLLLTVGMVVAHADGDPNDLTGDPVQDIMDSVASGAIDKVKTLLEAGGSLGVTNKYGETPMHVAALSKRWKMLEFLLARGGNPSAVTDGEYEGHETRVRRSVLEWWVVHCAVRPIKLLVVAGADLSYVDEEGYTVLDRAERSGERCKDVVTYLKEQGAKASQGGNTDLKNEL